MDGTSTTSPSPPTRREALLYSRPGSRGSSAAGKRRWQADVCLSRRWERRVCSLTSQLGSEAETHMEALGKPTFDSWMSALALVLAAGLPCCLPQLCFPCLTCLTCHYWKESTAGKPLLSKTHYFPGGWFCSLKASTGQSLLFYS